MKDPMEKMLDKSKAQARAKEMGEGVEFVSIEKFEVGGKVGVKTVFKFADINKLRYSNSGAMGMDDMPGAKKKEANKNAPVFKYADGKLTIAQKLPKERRCCRRKGRRGQNERSGKSHDGRHEGHDERHAYDDENKVCARNL